MIDQRELRSEATAKDVVADVVHDVADAPPTSTVRAFAAVALTSSAAGAMAGGVFGSGVARTLAATSALFGVGLAVAALRAGRRAVIVQALVLPAAVFVGALALIPGSADPADMGSLVREAISAGRLLRPPAPFDPGWRPILVVLFTMLGFASAWVSTDLRRPKIGLALPLPILGLTAISQPAEGELVAGLLAFVPLLAALALLFGTGRGAVTQLSSAFEIKRALRGVIVLAVVVGGVVALNRSDALFPKPIYDPADQPRKPKPIPLGQVRDRVLFEVDGKLSGPWRTGVLDVYDGRAWRLPAFDPDRFEPLPADGRIDPGRAGDVTVRFTIRDLGNAATLPGVATPAAIDDIRAAGGIDLVFDPRTDLFRLPTGRVPSGLVYEMALPSYPDAAKLRGAGRPLHVDEDHTYAPRPPQQLARLIDDAPANPWDRLEFLRGRLNDVAVAKGAGIPKDVPPSKVADLLFGSSEGTPFEIVAAEALLARWAGVPSRIGFGFDGVLTERRKKVVRPKLASNWLEAYFEGFGWVPLISPPKQAKATLETDPNARFDPTIEPSKDIAVEVFIPVEVESIRLLYERIRDRILQALPWVLGVLAVYLSIPALRRALRRRKRRRWAEGIGPRAQITVEYVEFRDLATDLGVGDPYATPLNYLDVVVEDDEHAELAWLVGRALYGDLSETVSADDVRAAREMSASLRTRMFRAQPWQTRVLAVLSRASLKEPYTLEVPSVRRLRLPRVHLRRRGRERARVGAGRS